MEQTVKPRTTRRQRWYDELDQAVQEVHDRGGIIDHSTRVRAVIATLLETIEAELEN